MHTSVIAARKSMARAALGLLSFVFCPRGAAFFKQFLLRLKPLFAATKATISGRLMRLPRGQFAFCAIIAFVGLQRQKGFTLLTSSMTLFCGFCTKQGQKDISPNLPHLAEHKDYFLLC
jgi:hypothetical protein